MKVVIQRVTEASVEINNKTYSQIQSGLCILVGFEESDTTQDLDWICNKICNMRIFGDANGKMNHSIAEIAGEILLVSQFTLYASTTKGNRPSFTQAAKPEIAIPLYEQTINLLETLLPKPIATGIFGADMKVTLTNDGPVTILLNSKNKA